MVTCSQKENPGTSTAQDKSNGKQPKSAVRSMHKENVSLKGICLVPDEQAANAVRSWCCQLPTLFF